MQTPDDLRAAGAGRHLRPESSASTRSKYSRQSSNSSSTNTRHRSLAGSSDTEKGRDRGQMERRGPSGASLLQERLREKKAARLGEREKGTDSSMLLDSSDVSNSPQRGASTGSGKDRDGRPGSSGDRPAAKKGMGVKEMEAAASALHKENFNLKLTVQFHQRKQLELEGRLEAAEERANEQADDQVELQSVNEQLLAELETRDQALEESMGIICDLEEEIEILKRQLDTRSPDIRSGSASRRRSHSAIGSGSQGSVPSPPQRDDAGNSMPIGTTRRKRTPGLIARMPSFLSDHSEGAEALRSLYLPTEQEGQSRPSLPKLSEELGTDSEHTEGMDSPRLSVLSESSFLSVYGGKALSLDGFNAEGGDEGRNPDYRRHRKSTSVEKWVDDRANASSSAPKRPSGPKVANIRIGQFNSINDIIESPLQRLERLNQSIRHPSLPLQNDSHPAILSGDRGSMGHSKKADNTRRKETASFEYENGLPPTPDTISTSTLRRHGQSGENLGPEGSERVQGRGQSRVGNRTVNSSLTNLVGARPHSAGETITSRREGHGWDTVTQSEVTTSDGDASAPNTFDPWIALGREKRRLPIQPPDMFTFGGDDDDDWGADDSSNVDAGSYLPPLKPHERNLTRARNPTSEDTVVGPSHLRRSYSTDSSPRFRHRGPLSKQISPDPPERSSSLAAASPPEKRTRRSRQAEASISISSIQPGLRAAGALPATQSQVNSKRSRVVRLFGLGRSEQQSNATPPPVVPSVITQPGPSNRSQSFTLSSRRRRNSMDLKQFTEDAPRASGAIPPPFARYPKSKDGSGNAEAQIARPLSAASLESNVRARRTRQRDYEDGFGIDGAGDAREDLSLGTPGNAIISGTAKRESKDSKPQGRKWLRFGRGESDVLNHLLNPAAWWVRLLLGYKESRDCLWKEALELYNTTSS